MLEWRGQLRAGFQLVSRWTRSATAQRVLVLLLSVFSVSLAYAWYPGQDGFFDSAFYLDGARHLAAGDGYVSAVTDADRSDYAPVTRWAPGFPAFTALLMRSFDVPALQAASVVLGLAYVGLVVASVVLASAVFGPNSRALSLLCALLVACNSGVMATLDSLLSDLPFGALAVVNTALALKLARTAQWHWGVVLLFAALLAGMFFVRYAGALYIPGVLAALALSMRLHRRSLRQIAWNLGRVVVLLSAFVGVWIARNLQVASLPFGSRIASSEHWHEHARRALHGFFAWWFSLQELARSVGAERWLLGLTLATAVACVLLLLQRSVHMWEGLLFTLLPALSYAGLMIAAASRVKLDSIEHVRFWVPVWPLTFVAVSCIAAHAAARWHRASSAVVIASLLIFLWTEVTWLRDALPAANQQRGLLTDTWQAAAATLPEPAECRLYATDVRPLMLHRSLGPASEIPGDVSAFNLAASKHERVCLAVFSKRLRVSTTAERRRQEQNKVVSELQREGRLERVSASAGVAIYALHRDGSR